MLVIRRRAGEIVVIGSNVELEILEIGHSQVKLGIRAPREILVLRKEIQVTKDENVTASHPLPLTAVNRLRGAFQKGEGAVEPEGRAQTKGQGESKDSPREPLV